MADPLAIVVEDGTGVATANSYVTLARADAILNARPHGADWGEADEYKRQQALISAFDLLNCLNWKGERATATGSGAWPRAGVSNRYGDAAIESDAVHEDIEHAQALLARRLLQTDIYERADQQAVLGSSSLGRSRSVQVGHPANLSIIPQEVWLRIGPYVHRHSIRLVRAA